MREEKFQLQSQGENKKDARFDTSQRPIITQEREAQGGGQPMATLMDVEELVEIGLDRIQRLEHIAELIENSGTFISVSDRQALQNHINRLKKENTGLKATVEELTEKNLKLTRQVLDFEYDKKRISDHQCDCQQLQALLDRAKEEVKESESAANHWKIAYEAAQHVIDNYP